MRLKLDFGTQTTGLALARDIKTRDTDTGKVVV